MPKISIIVPVYGVEKYIRKCLESLLNQTYKDLEIIIVNDGTKDNSMNIIKEYLDDSRIKVINKENGGISSARNKGLEYARGKYIAFVDSDDWVDKKLYENILKTEIDEDIIIFNYTYYNERKHKLEKTRIVKNKLLNKKKGYLFFRESSHSCFNKIYKTEYLKKIKAKFKEELKIGEDIFWNVETLFLTDNVKYIEEAGYIYRYKREGSLTNSLNLKIEETSYLKLIEYFDIFILENEKKLNEISKLRLELEKEFWKMKVTKEVKIDMILPKLKKFFSENILEEDYIIKNVFRDILKYKQLKNISDIVLLDKFYWKRGILDYRTLVRILKNKLRRLKK